MAGVWRAEYEDYGAQPGKQGAANSVEVRGLHNSDR